MTSTWGMGKGVRCCHSPFLTMDTSRMMPDAISEALRFLSLRRSFVPSMMMTMSNGMCEESAAGRYAAPFMPAPGMMPVPERSGLSIVVVRPLSPSTTTS